MNDFDRNRFVSSSREASPECDVIYKINNSAWRWGMNEIGWNELVDAYDGIRSFSFHPDFEIRLDHTTGHNARGYSEYHRVFLDGIFAFIIYYRGNPVMTIGFSVMSGRRLLLQQIQLHSQKNNRWLYKLPTDRKEFVVGLLRKHFSQHQLFMIDGGDATRMSMTSYLNGQSKANEKINKALSQPELEAALEEHAFFSKKIEHLESQIPRVTKLYRTVRKGRPLLVNSIRHWPI